MSSEEELIKECFMLLRVGAFIEVRHIVKMNPLVRLKDELEKAGAIADVLHAAENPLPDGSSDLYGMMRVTPPRPVIFEDYEKLMNLLDSRHNRFPFCQEASVRASLAWSSLCNPTVQDEENLETQGYILGDIDVGGSQIGDESRGDITEGGLCGEDNKGVMEKEQQEKDSVICSNVIASENLERSEAMHENPLALVEIQETPQNQVRSNDTAFVLVNDNVGPGIDNEIIIISDDEDEDEDGKVIMTMARTAKVYVVNRRRVKIIPLKMRKQK